MSQRSACAASTFGGHPPITGIIDHHSTLTWQTVPHGQNTTDYHWDLVVDLCAFCSGMLRGFISRREIDARPDGEPEDGL